jgi:hypothetical protein
MDTTWPLKLIIRVMPYKNSTLNIVGGENSYCRAASTDSCCIIIIKPLLKTLHTDVQVYMSLKQRKMLYNNYGNLKRHLLIKHRLKRSV